MKNILLALAIATTLAAAPAEAASRLKDTVRKPAVTAKAPKRVVKPRVVKPRVVKPVRKAPVKRAGTLGALKR